MNWCSCASVVIFSNSVVINSLSSSSGRGRKVGLILGRGVVRGVGQMSQVRNGAVYICAVVQSQCLEEDLKK